MSEVNTLIGLDAMRHFLSLIYTIPFIKDEKPKGVMVVAPPDTGKSFALMHITSPHAVVISDTTGAGLEKVVLETAKKHNYTGYAVIPDLIRLTSRQYGFKAFTQLMNILLEEGLQRIERANLSIRSPKALRFGLIAALTVDSFIEHYDELNSIGFISRQLVVSFSYCDYDLKRILSHTAKGTRFPYIMIKPPEGGNVEVEVPDERVKGINKLAKFICKMRGDEAIKRATEQARSLVKAQAVLNGHHKVTSKDLNEVFSLLPLFRVPEIVKVPGTGRKKKKYGMFMKAPFKGGTDAEYFLLRGIVEDKDPTKYFGKNKRFPEYELPIAISRLEGKLIKRHEDGSVSILKLDE